jgi:cytochrome c-type biogenesis protein CcmH/NrfF
MTAQLLVQPPLAHAGHWLASILYLAPVVILAIGVLLQRRNDRLARERGEVAPDDDVPFTDQ